MIDGNGNRHAEFFHVLDMAAKIDQALLEGLGVFLLQLFLGHPAVHLERPDGCNNYSCGRCQPRLAALDV